MVINRSMLNRLATSSGISIQMRCQNGALLICSGCGLMMSILDDCPHIAGWLDIDFYRNSDIDFELVGIYLDRAGFDFIILAGWFTLDNPLRMERIERGLIKTPVIKYNGLIDSYNDTFRSMAASFAP